MRGLILLLGLGGCTALGAPEPTPWDGSVASVVAVLLKQEHYAPKPIDDALSERWCEAYIDALDPNHMIFLASDVAGFQKRYGKKLEDDLTRMHPDMVPAAAIYDIYQTRLAERVAAARAALASPVALDTNREWIVDRDKEPFPADAKAADQLWRDLVTEEVLRGALGKETQADVASRLGKRFDRLQKETDEVERADVLEIYLDALTELFDPHSVYFKPATNDNFDITVTNAVQGIGARLQSKDDYTVVDEVLAGGPAALDERLRAGDRIIAVAQGNGDFVDIVGMRLDHVVQLIRGKKGTTVRLQIIPVDAPNMGTTATLSLVRDQVELEQSDADAAVLEDASGGPKIGYIDLPSFYGDLDANTGESDRGATADVRRLLGELSAQHVDGVILDLRENGGGSLRESVDLTGLFIDKGPVVQVRDSDGRVTVLSDQVPGTSWDGPLMVLTSPLSASASEILAGAIQDYGRGLIVGSKTTHGKGSVQQVLDLDDFLGRLVGKPSDGSRAGALKLTTQQFYRVSGGSTQIKGVSADIALPSPWEGLDVYEADLPNALPWAQIDAASFARVGEPSALLQPLSEHSQARVASSEDFKKLDQDTDKRAELRARKTISLNLEKRKAMMADEPKDLEEDPEVDEDAAPKTVAPKDPAAEAAKAAERRKKDYILQEAAAIMRDQINLSK